MAATINRFLLVLFLVAAVACGVLGNVALRERQRADRAEQRLAAVTSQVTATKTSSSARAYRASNGVVLTAEDIARLEHRTPEQKKSDAELEYIIETAASETLRARAK
jgi:Flp pilus assembly protein TadB